MTPYLSDEQIIQMQALQLIALRAQLLTVTNELEGERKRLDWLEAQMRKWQYEADLAIQSDVEDGIWVTRIYRHHCGTLPQGHAYDDRKSATVREAIDAAMAVAGEAPADAA